MTQSDLHVESPDDPGHPPRRIGRESPDPDQSVFQPQYFLISCLVLAIVVTLLLSCLILAFCFICSEMMSEAPLPDMLLFGGLGLFTANGPPKF